MTDFQSNGAPPGVVEGTMADKKGEDVVMGDAEKAKEEAAKKDDKKDKEDAKAGDKDDKKETAPLDEDDIALMKSYVRSRPRAWRGRVRRSG